MKVITGDKFASFATKTDNICYSGFVSVPEKFHNAPLILGLGLSREELCTIHNIAKKNNIKLFFDRMPADCSVTHKQKDENCLISQPIQIEDNIYESQLILDDEDELLLDHITGLHIQGMVLIEACRQMFIAVAVDYFSHNFFANERSGSISRMDCQFKSYVFPLPALIRYKRTSITEDKERESVSFNATIEIIQSNRVVFSMDMQHAYYKREKMTSIEQHKALSACKRLDESIYYEQLR